MLINISEYNDKNVKTNIFLKDGRTFLGKDIPMLPDVFVKNFVSFIENGSVVSFPISEIKEIETYIDED